MAVCLRGLALPSQGTLGILITDHIGYYTTHDWFYLNRVLLTICGFEILPKIENGKKIATVISLHNPYSSVVWAIL